MISLLRSLFCARLAVAGCSALVSVTLCAQTSPTVTPTAPLKLEQLESTYQTKVKELHAPVLQEYLNALEMLRRQYSLQGQTSKAALVEAEIAGAKKLAEGPGIISYTPLVPPPPLEMVTPPGVPLPPAPPDAPATPNVVLQISDARSVEPTHDARSRSAALGTAKWLPPAMPAGTYDIMVIYSARDLKETVPLKVTFAGQEISTALTADAATSSARDFRPLKIGTITLTQPTFSNPATDLLTLQADTQLPPRIQVRSVILGKPRARN